MARWSAGLLAAVVVVLAGCGASSGSSGSSTPQASSAKSATTTSAPPEPAGPNPSESAKMICAQEARKDVDASLGVAATQVTTPSWVDSQYSCQYQYPGGVISMSVKELNSAAETTAYFDGLGQSLGRQPDDLALGQGGFITTNGSVVARKDWKVLLVDVSQLPEQFGTPPLDHSDAAVSVAATIMGCWSGA